MILVATLLRALSQEKASAEIRGELFEQISQRSRKGVGGQRGLAQGNPSRTTDSGLFPAPLFLCPLRKRRRTQFWGTFFAVFWALVGRQPPSCQPLFETSEFPGDFFVDFSGLFPWKKGGKLHPKIHSKIQIGIWESPRPTSTLQGSVLDSSRSFMCKFFIP